MVTLQNFLQNFWMYAFFIGERPARNGAHHEKREGYNDKERQKAGPYPLKDVFTHRAKLPSADKLSKQSKQASKRLPL
jgi:hypothetical protein